MLIKLAMSLSDEKGEMLPEYCRDRSDAGSPRKSLEVLLSREDDDRSSGTDLELRLAEVKPLPNLSLISLRLAKAAVTGSSSNGTSGSRRLFFNPPASL